jgi:hypothetical protein
MRDEMRYQPVDPINRSRATKSRFSSSHSGEVRLLLQQRVTLTKCISPSPLQSQFGADTTGHRLVLVDVTPFCWEFLLGAQIP